MRDRIDHTAPFGQKLDFPRERFFVIRQYPLTCGFEPFPGRFAQELIKRSPRQRLGRITDGAGKGFVMIHNYLITVLKARDYMHFRRFLKKIFVLSHR